MQILISARDKAGKVIHGIRRKLKKLGNTAKKVGRSITGAFAKVGKSLFSFKSALIGVAGIAGIGYLIKRSLDATDEMAKMSRAIGVSVENLQRLRHAASLGGLEATQLDKAVQKLAVNMADAAKGTGEAKDIFEKYGISVTRADGSLRSVIDVMADVSDATVGISNKTARAELAYRLFGARGGKMINVLKGGSRALRESMKEADKLGFVMGKKTVEGVERANDAFTRMKSAMNGVWAKLSASLAPALEKFATWWAKFTGSFSQTIQPLFVWLQATLENLGVEFGTAEDAGKKWGNTIGYHTVEIIKGIINFFTEVKKGETDFERFKTTGSNALTTISDAAGLLLRTFRWILNVVRDISRAWDKLGSIGRDFGIKVANNVSKGENIVSATGRAIGSTLADQPADGSLLGTNTTNVTNIYTQNSRHGVDNAINSRGNMTLQVGRKWVNGVMQ
ncbi:MAG: phage tail tape measure protein [Candidatus Ruthia sp.]|jgi:hypothetical protein|nr:phage tail tape measure protein [Candidatus Ruthturnera sp.]